MSASPPPRSPSDRARRGLALRRPRPAAKRPRSRRRQPRKQGGIAILAVVTAVAICLIIVNEFASRTTIDMLQARNTLDQTRAHFLARSAVNLGELMLRMQRALDNLPQGARDAFGLPPDLSVTEFSDQLMAAFGGSDEEVMDAIGVSSMDDVKGLGASIGSFGLKMVPVDGKINVNCVTGAADKRRTATMLKSLFFPFAQNAMFDVEDAEGWRRDYETQVEAIIDYIDEDTMRVDVADRPAPAGGGGRNAAVEPLPQAGNEDYGYENLRDRYQAKNKNLDSVGELRLVRGIDDRMWTLFGGAFRVHGGCRISVRALDDVTVIAAVISASADPNDPVLHADPTVVWKLAGLVVQAKALGMTFPTVNDFKKFIADPLGELAAIMAAGMEVGAAMPSFDPSMLGIPPNFKGPELVDNLVRSVLIDGPPVAFQVEAYGDIERAPPFLPLRRTIRGMWDQKYPLPAGERRWQGPPETGAWVWMREE